MNKADQNKKNIDALFESMHSVCTISLCLIEQNCMSIRAEDEEDEDKKSIALMGRKESEGGDILSETTVPTKMKYMENNDFP